MLSRVQALGFFVCFLCVRFCSLRFGKQNFNWLVLLVLGRTVKHCFSRSLSYTKHILLKTLYHTIALFPQLVYWAKTQQSLDKKRNAFGKHSWLKLFWSSIHISKLIFLQFSSFLGIIFEIFMAWKHWQKLTMFLIDAWHG